LRKTGVPQEKVWLALFREVGGGEARVQQRSKRSLGSFEKDWGPTVKVYPMLQDSKGGTLYFIPDNAFPERLYLGLGDCMPSNQVKKFLL
jgi:hypothetical protein